MTRVPSHPLLEQSGSDGASTGLGVNPALYLASSVTLGNLDKLSQPHDIISKMRKMILIALTSWSCSEA